MANSAGHNNMFGAFWEFEDPTSKVVGYEWCVGDKKVGFTERVTKLKYLLNGEKAK